MEWNVDGESDENAGHVAEVNNPWISPVPAASSSSSSHAGPASGSGSRDSVVNKSRLPANPLYQGSPELGSFPDEGPSRQDRPVNGILNPEATRPTLFRLTSGGLSGLLNGFDSLAFSNASQESLSTEDTGANGTRRSLDELRRLSIKGKGRALDNDFSHNDLLGEESLRPSKPQGRGREALLHPVEEGDTLQRLALLYGCTVPAIRSANKMWAKDPIYPRKTLYIPLDACKQPPSKEVEFVHKSGEDQLEMYFREAKVHASPSFSQISGRNGAAHINGRSRSDSLRQGALGDSPRPLTPYHDSPSFEAASPDSSRRSSHDHSRQTSSSTYFNYLSSTNSEYDASEDNPGLDLAGTSTASSQAGTTSVRGNAQQNYSDSKPDSGLSAEKSCKKALQIVQIPGTTQSSSSSSGGTLSKERGKSPLISVDTLEDTASPLLPHERVTSGSSTSLGTPNGSSDRLNTLTGTSTNLRMRPKSPFDTTAFPTTASGSSVSSPLARPPSRPRKISKEAVPTSASASRSSTSSLPKLPGSIGRYLTSAGAGLVSSLMGDRSDANSGWLATNELETEMQMAREYQTRHQNRSSISSDRTLHARRRSQATLRDQPTSSSNTAGRRDPLPSSERP